MKITSEESELLCWGDSETYEVVEDGEWVAEGKYDFKRVIFKDSEGKAYALFINRSGSYHTDYYYSWEDSGEVECPEVEKVEVVQIDWKTKKT
jgi:hypothetical protein